MSGSICLTSATIILDVPPGGILSVQQLSDVASFYAPTVLIGSARILSSQQMSGKCYYITRSFLHTYTPAVLTSIEVS